MSLSLIESKDAFYIVSNDFIEEGMSSIVIKRNTMPNQISLFEMDD